MKDEILNKIRRVAREKDGKDATELTCKLFEEGGELSRMVLWCEGADGFRYRGSPVRDKLLEEIADCQIVLLAIAERMGVSDTEIEEWVLRKLEKWESVVGEASEIREPVEWLQPEEYLEKENTKEDVLEENLVFVCAFCGQDATCLGAYQEEGEISTGYACDKCCGHSNDDGWCKPI